MAGWALSGRWGAEVDAIGEEFGSGVIFDDRISDEPIDDLAEDLRYREESTRVSGLFRFNLQNSSNQTFRFGGRVKASPARTKAELTSDLQKITSLGRFELLDVFQAQGGEDDPGGGIVNWVTATWRTPLHRGANRFRTSLRHEISRAGSDSLAQVLDYTVVRPSLRWGRRNGSFETILEAGSRHKRGAGAARDHDGVFAELRGERSWGAFGRTELEGRIESRSYAEADSITPSYQELSFRSNTAWPWGRGRVVRTRAGFEIIEYAIDSSLLRDHHKLEAELGLEWRFAGTRRLVPTPIPQRAGGSDPDSVVSGLAGLDDIFDLLDSVTGDFNDPGETRAPPDSLGGAAADSTSPSGTTSDVASRTESFDPTTWSLRLTGGGTRLRNQVGSSGEYDEGEIGLSLSRESISGGWWNVEIESGLRDYAMSEDPTGLVFEGYSFSLTTTDYKFLRSSVLAEFPLPVEFSFEIFGQVEREWHSEAANDLQLWILTASLTRSF